MFRSTDLSKSWCLKLRSYSEICQKIFVQIQQVNSWTIAKLLCLSNDEKYRVNETLGQKKVPLVGPVELCQQIDGHTENVINPHENTRAKSLIATAIPLGERMNTDQFQTPRWVKSFECDAGQLSPAHYGLNAGPALSPGTFGITLGYVAQSFHDSPTLGTG